MREKYADLLAWLNPELWDEDQREAGQEIRRSGAAIRGIDALLLSVARQEVVAARNEPGTDPQVADRMLRELDLRSLRTGPWVTSRRARPSE